MNNIMLRPSDILNADRLQETAARLPHMLGLGHEIAAHGPRQAALMGILENLVHVNFPMLTEEEWRLIFNALKSCDVDNFLFNLDRMTLDTDAKEIATLVFDHAGYVPRRIGQLTQMESFSCCFVAHRFGELVDYTKPINIAEILAEITGRSVCCVLLSED